MNLWYGLKWIMFPRGSCNYFSNKIAPKLTWNLMQAQTEPKLHPETANMEFEQVITKRSATLKGDLKFSLEPKWFLRRGPGGSCRFHVTDFRATLFFTSYCAHGIMLWTWVEPSQYQLDIAPSKLCGNRLTVSLPRWMADDSGSWMAFPELLVEN